jgi:hypothetical protein
MRSNSKMAKKGQYAATMILLGMLVLFIVYVFLAYPEEKARVLNISVPNETKNQISSSPLGEGTTLLFSSGEISEIGRSSGETVFSFSLGNIYVSYPTKEKILSQQELMLRTNIFKKDTSLLSANNINLENTKDVIIKLNITFLKGTPIISLFLNGSKIFERQLLNNGEINVIIPKNYLNIDNPIELKLSHKGAFWTTQEAQVYVTIVQEYYYPENPSAEKVLPLGQSNMKGNEFRLSFVPKEVKQDGDITIKVNDKKVYTGTLENNSPFTISKRLEDSGIKVGNNIISFETAKGGVYNLTDAKVEFVAVSTPATKKIYTFDISKDYLNTSKKIIIGIKVDRIIKPGYIYVKINDGPSYYFSNDDLASGAWVYTEINKTHLKELSNRAIVDSPNGRYRLTGFAIIAE